MKRLAIAAIGVLLIPLSGWIAATGGRVTCRVCPLGGTPCFYCEGRGNVSAYRAVFDPAPDVAVIQAELATRCACGLYPKGSHPECEWINKRVRTTVEDPVDRIDR